jgi:hypothetical protein
MAGHAMTTARQSMALQYDRNTVQSPMRMSLDKSKFAQMKRALGLVAQHRWCSPIEGVRAFKLAGNHGAVAAGGIP